MRPFILGGLIFVLGTAAIIWQRQNIASIFTGDSASDKITLEELWEEQRYEEINLRTDEILDLEPMNLRALMYRGFSNFYRGVNQFSLEEKISFFDRSIQDLRKARMLEPDEFLGQIYYVLGKAYYYKGKFYADQAIRYLIKAEAEGYVGDDSYEYLGLAYSELGDYEKSAESFLKAVERDATDMRYLALAQAYFNQGNTARAEEYLVRTLNKTNDISVEIRTRFLLGKIYFETDQLPKSEDQYTSILEKDPKSADAYYFIGEIYLKYDKIAEARYYWRQAYNIDSSHYGARLRLF